MSIPVLGPLLVALFDFLKCLVLFLLGALQALLVLVLNVVIAAVMAVVGPALSLLPEVDLGSSSLGGLSSYLAWANYFLPLSFGVSLVATVVVVLVAWTGVAAILRWAKVVR